jgi:hypothetical protein
MLVTTQTHGCGSKAEIGPFKLTFFTVYKVVTGDHTA